MKLQKKVTKGYYTKAIVNKIMKDFESGEQK